MLGDFCCTRETCTKEDYLRFFVAFFFPVAFFFAIVSGVACDVDYRIRNVMLRNVDLKYFALRRINEEFFIHADENLKNHNVLLIFSIMQPWMSIVDNFFRAKGTYPQLILHKFSRESIF